MAWVDFERINQIANRIQLGEQNLVEDLMVTAYPFVEWVIRQTGYFLSTGGDSDDLRQEGIVDVFKALETWDPKIQPEFSRFARLCVERGLITTVRTATRKKHQLLNQAMSLDAPATRDKHGTESGESRLDRWDLLDTSGLGTDPAEAVDGSDVGELVEAFYEHTSDLEREALNRCVLGSQSYQEAAEELGVTTKSLDNAMQRVRRKILKRAEELADDPRFSPDTRALLARTAKLAREPRLAVTDEELRASLPVELLRPSSLKRFSAARQQWTVPPDRLLVEFPDIADYAKDGVKRVVLAGYLERKPWSEIAEQVGVSENACKHHLRRMCTAAAKGKGVTREKVSAGSPLLQRVKQLWVKGIRIAEMEQTLAHVATPAEIKAALFNLYNRQARKRLRQIPQVVETRRIPLVRLNRIPALLRKAKPLLIPEYTETLKLYMQGYSHQEIAARREVALSCIGKNDLPVIRQVLREVPGFEWLYDPKVRERQIRLLALEALGLTREQALEQLPPQHRPLYELYLEGCAHKEIDAELRLVPGMAEKRLHYCRSCIRRTDDFRQHMRRRNVPERDRAIRIHRDPDKYRCFKVFGHLLDPERRRLLDLYYEGIGMAEIAAAFDRSDAAGRQAIWARIRRIGEWLKTLEAAPRASQRSISVGVGVDVDTDSSYCDLARDNLAALQIGG